MAKSFDVFADAFVSCFREYVAKHDANESGPDLTVRTTITETATSPAPRGHEGPQAYVLFLSMSTTGKYLPFQPPADATKEDIEVFELINRMRDTEETVIEKWWLTFVPRGDGGGWEFDHAECEDDSGNRVLAHDAEWVGEIMAMLKAGS